jgi:hypothetical protein
VPLPSSTFSRNSRYQQSPSQERLFLSAHRSAELTIAAYPRQESLGDSTVLDHKEGETGYQEYP